MTQETTVETTDGTVWSFDRTWFTTTGWLCGYNEGSTTVTKLPPQRVSHVESPLREGEP